jgi:4-amino-4-deoxy-L-arabinose transferase-like glycosyltransferase
MTEIAATPAPVTARRQLALPATLDLSPSRLALPVLALLSGGLYLLNLTVSGYANTYYALAAQAGSQSWSAWFFGALDAQGFITIDKPPLATWLMGLSVRVLCLSSWSILLP